MTTPQFRVPPSRWSRDIGLAVAVFVLLLWPALLLAGPVGVAVLAVLVVTAANVTAAVRARRSGQPRA